MKNTYKVALILLAIVVRIASAHQHLSTNNIEAIRLAVGSLGERFEPKDTFIVFDHDNTLLTLTTELGSDQWFSWQESLLFGGNSDSKLLQQTPLTI
ncbi:MAG: DUF2608 domain-containing protein [Bdellovibrionota bacterium]